MYAVIRTGGKQYRVSPGDLLVVEKLEGADVGGAVTFGEVLMLGGADGAVTVGAPLVQGASVTATLIETRKGEKIKVFKKIRRQGYRRTKGHRQPESVLRVTALAGAGGESRWNGTVDFTPRTELVARSRGLSPRINAPDSANLPEGTPTAETPASETVAAPAAPAPRRARAAAPPASQAAPEPQAEAAETGAPETGAPETGAFVEQPLSEVGADAPETRVDPNAAAETGSMAAAEAAPKKPRAPRKPKPSPDAAPEDGEPGAGA